MITEALKQVGLFILNPVFNPDGHERFGVKYNSSAVGSPEGFAHGKGDAVGRRIRSVQSLSVRYEPQRQDWAQVAGLKPLTGDCGISALDHPARCFVRSARCSHRPSTSSRPNPSRCIDRPPPDRIEKWEDALRARANSVRVSGPLRLAVCGHGKKFDALRSDLSRIAGPASIRRPFGMTYETDGGRQSGPTAR